MFNEDELLLDGERTLGRYTVVLVTQGKNGRWMPALMQMDAMVTNFRLLLRPHRKKYRPASLPARYIKSAELGRRGNYHCVDLLLSTDHMLHMMLSTGKLDDLRDDLSAMKVPPPKFQFDDSVAKEDIERLITFFGREPLRQAE